jgi:hypothetical protein
MPGQEEPMTNFGKDQFCLGNYEVVVVLCCHQDTVGDGPVEK